MNCEHWSHFTSSLCSQEGLSVTVASLQLPREGLSRPHSRAHDLAVISVGGLTNLYPLSCSPQASLLTKSAAPGRPASAMKDHGARSDAGPPPMSLSAPSSHSAPELVAPMGNGGGSGSTVHPHCCPQPASSPCCHLVTSDHSTMSHGPDHHQAAGPTLGAKIYWLNG